MTFPAKDIQKGFMSKDRYFEIYYKSGYACLTVYPQEEYQNKIYPEDILGRLKILGVKSVRVQKIAEIIDDAGGEPVPIAPWPDGAALGPVLTLDVSEDNMTARLKIEPEKQGGEPLSAGMLKDFLKTNKIIFGIQTESLNTVILKKVYDQFFSAAIGRAPVDEKAAEPEYFFVTNRGKPFKELEYERIDLKELNFIQNKNTGDLLARVGKPIPPADGMDVYGKTIHAKRGVSPTPFSAGEGAKLSDDGQTISAAVEGNAKLIDHSVVVEPLISVENVDYSNGNMDFNGAIDIEGRIADGFSVKAKSDIQIGKSVSKVKVESGGDIILKAGISGNDEGTIVCGGDLYARYIENSSIICRGNVYVEEAIMHSSLRAEGDIILKGKRAEICGGKIIAGGSVRCKKLGSINEPHTEIFLGIDLETSNAMEKLQDAVSKGYAAADKLDNQIKQIKNALKKSESGDVSVDKLGSALSQLEGESKAVNIKVSEHLRDLHELKRDAVLNENSFLEVETQIYGQVHVYFNHLRWDSPNKGTGKTRLVVKQGRLLEK